MNNETIINELAGIRASAQVLATRAAKLEKMLTEKEPAKKQRPGFKVELATVLANREKRYTKK